MNTKMKFNGESNGDGGHISEAPATARATNGKTRILIVEDEPAMVQGLRDNFEYEGYEVISAGDGLAGLERALSDSPDLVVLDVMMPRMSGLDVCKQLKSKKPGIPIIMLTARGQEIDKVVGLKIGADDYVTKPFSFMELMARVEAILRRTVRQPESLETFEFGTVVVHFRKFEVTRNGVPVELSAREFNILKYFIAHRSEVVSRDQLLDAVWGYESFPLTRTVDMHIAKLRHKIEDTPGDPKHIVTVHRLGYKFVA